MRSLYLSNTQVADLDPLRTLSNLQSLDLSLTPVADLDPLRTLSNLQSLYLSNSQVADLDPLRTLSNLQSLSLSYTRVADLDPLRTLSNLQSLYLSGTRVTSLLLLLPLIRLGLPVKRRSKNWGDPGIYVEGCQLTHPPDEIVNQGNAAILNYFEALKSGETDYLYEAKLLILGDGSAGKTSLLRRLYEPEKPLPTEDETTRGISVLRHEFNLRNGRRFRLNVWDFGGQQIYHATHQFFLTNRSLYLLVDDTRSDDKSVSSPGFKKWLDRIEVFGGDSPVLIFQNEKGGRSKGIDFEGIQRRYTNVKQLYSGNLAQSEAASSMRDGIEFFVSSLKHIGEQLPARWLTVRADIEARAAETPYITQKEYFEIYERHLEPDRLKALHLSQYLHDLGVFLHYQKDPVLKHTVILQNEWATEAVFRILDSEKIKVGLGASMSRIASISGGIRNMPICISNCCH